MDFIASLFSITTKLAPRTAFAIMLATGSLLFAPTNVLHMIGVQRISEDHRQSLGLAFVIASSVVAVWIVVKLSEAYSQKSKNKQFSKSCKEHLGNLSGEEKSCLRQFLDEDTSTIHLPYNSGVAGALAAKNLIFRSSSLSSYYTNFPYTIQPVVRKMLIENPDLLE